MTSRFRLSLADNLLPVQAFFNVIPDDKFLSTIETMLKGIGSGFNEVGCIMPAEEKENDPPLEGGIFYVGNEEIWINDMDLLKYTKMALEAYETRHPEEVERVNKIRESAEASLT